ncbi:MAG: hypothetical protein HUJ95_00870 [Bacteroidales bacterium]|nr:hypothetical protein [Bacteroidales bacterium]
MKKAIIIFTMVVLALTSCKDNNFYQIAYMGNFAGEGTIRDDDGDFLILRQNTVIQSSEFPKEPGARLYIIFNQYSRTEQGRCDAEILGFSKPLTKDPLHIAEAPDSLTAKPLYVTSASYSGGYLNFSLMAHTDAAGKKMHTINLVYYTDGSDTLYVSFKHNTQIPVCETEVEYQTNPVMRFMACFPVYELVKDMKKPVISLEYPWYESSTLNPGKVIVKNNYANFSIDLTRYVQEYAKGKVNVKEVPSEAVQ